MSNFDMLGALMGGMMPSVNNDTRLQSDTKYPHLAKLVNMIMLDENYILRNLTVGTDYLTVMYEVLGEHDDCPTPLEIEYRDTIYTHVKSFKLKKTVGELNNSDVNLRLVSYRAKMIKPEYTYSFIQQIAEDMKNIPEVVENYFKQSQQERE